MEASQQQQQQQQRHIRENQLNSSVDHPSHENVCAIQGRLLFLLLLLLFSLLLLLLVW